MLLTHVMISKNTLKHGSNLSRKSGISGVDMEVKVEHYPARRSSNHLRFSKARCDIPAGKYRTQI
jgi:hypothetical protein